MVSWLISCLNLVCILARERKMVCWVISCLYLICVLAWETKVNWVISCLYPVCFMVWEKMASWVYLICLHLVCIWYEKIKWLAEFISCLYLVCVVVISCLYPVCVLQCGEKLVTGIVVNLFHSRSPLWSSGSPRMLLLILLIVLVREFESRRGKILNLFAKKKKDQELLRAPSVGKHSSTQVDEGRKRWSLLAIKMQGTNRSG